MHTVFVPLFLFSCASPSGTPSADTVRAVVDPDRTEHFFDAPFPDDAWLDSAGHVDLSSFPESPSEVLRDVVVGWTRRIGQTSQGFANHGAAYFRFEGPLDVPAALAGAVDDPLLLIDTRTGERIPLAVRFYDHADGDPFIADNLLAFAPALGHPPASGATLAAVVMESAGARPAENW